MKIIKLQKDRKQNHSRVVLPTVPVDFAFLIHVLVDTALY